MEVNIENPTELVNYLERSGRITAGTRPKVSVLGGGVSNRTVLVEQAEGTAWVLKQALPKLRVADDWYCDPARIELESLALQWLEKLIPEAVPRFIFSDKSNSLFAMTAVPRPHVNWKTLLLAGEIGCDLVQKFGELLGQIHRSSSRPANEWKNRFSDRTFFDALRLDPYYRRAAERNPSCAAFFRQLIDETRAVQEALVHGDFSPKNILVHEGSLILLDYEVMHLGDPAFDLGFSLTHLLSKANHLAPHRSKLLEATHVYWNSYSQSLSSARALTIGERAVRHTLGCLLARVDGRSPLEYLTAAERDRQRRVSTELMRSSPKTIPDLIDAFAENLSP